MGKVVKAVVGIVATVVGVVTGQWWLVAAGAALTMSSVMKVPKPTANAATEQRLSKRLEPEAFRKIIFGQTAGGADLRYWEVFGSEANNYVEVIASATHRIHAFGRFWMNEDLVTFSGTTATGQYNGHFSRRLFLMGQSGLGTPSGGHGKWTATASMTGCAYYILNYLYKQEKFPQGISSRYTQEVYGALVYDPRRDVRFGGTHVITDQTTWEYAPTDSNGVPIGRNNALQMLWYQLGWRINGKLVAGKGVDPADIDIDTFIQAANDCEVMGWYSDCILSTGDSHETNEGILEAAAQGNLLDTGGRFSYYVAIDDTANVAVELDEDDIIGDGYDWAPRDPLSTFFNEVAGTYIDPLSLYQPRPFPMVWDQAYYDADGRKERDTVALSAVQDPAQAQKLMRIKLNRSRFQGEFNATFTYKAMRARNYSIVRLRIPSMGWTEPRLFRVISYGIAAMGGIDLTLREEHPSIYGEGAVQELPPPSQGVGTNPFLEIEAGVVTPEAVTIEGDSGSTRDGIKLTYPTPHALTLRTELLYRKVGHVAYTTAVIPKEENTPVIQPLQPATAYEGKLRHVSIYGIPGPWSEWTTSTADTTTDSTDRVVYPPVVPGDPYVPVTDLRPRQPGADVTGTNTALDVYNVGGRPVAQVLADLDSVPGQIADAEDRAQTNLNNAVANFNTQVGALDTRLDEVEFDIDDPSTGLKARVGTVESVASDAASRVGVVEVQINAGGTGLLARTASLETATANLQTGKADASRVTVLEARAARTLNQLYNPTGGQGLDGWNESAPAKWYSSTWAWGTYFGVTLPAGQAVTAYMSSDPIPAVAGYTYTLSGKGYRPTLTTGAVSLGVTWYTNAEGTEGAGDRWIAEAYTSPAPDVGYVDVTPRTFTAPAGAASFRVWCWADSAAHALGDTSYAGFGLLKLETGSTATAFTDDATLRGLGADAAQIAARVGTVETATANLQTGKADASRVTVVEANVAALGRLDPSAVNGNPNFTDWPNPATAAASWSYAYGAESNVTRVTGDNGTGYAVDVTLPAGTPQEWATGGGIGTVSPGWYVIELDMENVSGTWHGGGARLFGYDASAILTDTAYVQLDVTPDVQGVVRGATPGPGRYSWRTLVQFTNPATTQWYFGVSVGGLFQTPAVPGRTKIHRAAFRPATDAEVELRQARGSASSISARFVSAETATANLQTGKADVSRVVALEARATAGSRGVSLFQNPDFSDWPTGQATPTGWSNGLNGAAVVYRDTGDGGRPYLANFYVPGTEPLTLDAAAVPASEGWYVIEAEYTLASGSLSGMAFILRGDDSALGYVHELALKPFELHGAGVIGRRYVDQALVQLQNANVPGRTINQVFLRAYANASGYLGSGGDSASKVVKVHRAGARPATAAEVELRQARGSASSVLARFTANEQATADLVTGKADVSRVQTLEAQVQTAGSGLLARTTSLETATANLQTGKADASRVSVVEARLNAGGSWENFDDGLNGWNNGNGPGFGNFPAGTVQDLYQGRRNVFVTNGTAGASLFSNELIQVDTSRKYAVHTGFHLTAGSSDGLLYIGLRCRDAAGNILYSDPGSYLYAAVVGYVSPAGWYDVRSNLPTANVPVGAQAPITGEGTGTWSIFPVGTKSVELLAYLNQGGDRTMALDYLRLVDITDGEAVTSLSARVTAEESATVDLYGRTQARWAIGASVPGADAFIEARAETSPGATPTSSVAIGARQFAVFNPAGSGPSAWRKALEVVNGNVVLSGGLQAGAFIRLGNGQGWPVALRAVDFSATDGAVVDFGTDLGGLPSLTFAMNNLAPLAAGETYDVRAVGLTATGFTMQAKINVPGTPTTFNRTASFTTSAFGSGGIYIDKTSDADSSDGNYRIVASGYNQHTVLGRSGDPPSPDDIDYVSGEIEVWAKKSGTWLKITSLYVQSQVDAKDYPNGVLTTTGGVWSLDETIQLGDDVDQVGLRHATPATYSYVGTFSNLIWTAPGSASSVRSATPNGEATRVTVRPQ